jgi:hypothetical protein
MAVYVTDWESTTDIEDPAHNIVKIVNCAEKFVRYTQSQTVPMPLEAPARREWEVGGTFLMKPAYRAPGIARLKVEYIWKRDVIKADDLWAKAEGFDNARDFMKTYVKLHHPKCLYMFDIESWDMTALRWHLWEELGDLDCWKIQFAVVERYPSKLKQWEQTCTSS